MPHHLPLSEVADIQAGMPTLPDGGQRIPVLTVKALAEGGRLVGPPDELVPGPVAASRYKLEAADIVLAARSTALRVALVDPEHEALPFNATLLRIRCRPGRLHPEFLVAWLSHPDGREAVTAMSRSSTQQMSLTVSALEDLEVPVPSYKEQLRLAALLSAARDASTAAIAAAEARLTLAREIAFSSLSSNR